MAIAKHLDTRADEPVRIDPNLGHWQVGSRDVYTPEETPARLERRSIADDLARIEAGPRAGVGVDPDLLVAFSSVLRVLGSYAFAPSDDPAARPVSPLLGALVSFLDALDPDGHASAELTEDLYWFVHDDVLMGDEPPPHDELSLASLYDHWEFAQRIAGHGVIERDCAYLSGLLRFLAERARR